jgi:hypothetical protein
MNLRVNLILETERRSAGPVQPRTIKRLVVLALAMIPVAAIVLFILSYRNLRRELNQTQAEWKLTQPKYEESLKLKEDLDAQTALLHEITAYKAARIEWGRQLDGLQQVTPPTIQLTALRVTHLMLVVTNGIPARTFELRLAGKAAPPRPETSVGALRDALAGRPPFADLVEAVDIPAGGFKRDPAGGDPLARVFEIVGKYRPRKLE